MRSDVRAFYDQVDPDYAPMSAVAAEKKTMNPFDAVLGPNQQMERAVLGMSGVFDANAAMHVLSMGDTGSTVASDAMSVGGAMLASAQQSAQSGADTTTALENAAVAGGAALIKAATSGSGSSSTTATNTSGGPWQPGQPIKIYDQTWDGNAKSIPQLKASADGTKTAAQIQGMARALLSAALIKQKNLQPFTYDAGGGKQGRIMVSATDLSTLQALQLKLGRMPTRAEVLAVISASHNARTITAGKRGGAAASSGTTASAGASLPLLAALGGAAMLALRAAG